MSLEKTATNSAEYQAHIESCKAGGLSVKTYTEQHSLKYSTFLYHYRKRYLTDNKEKLIAVQVKPDNAYKNELCRIELRTGHVLWIRDADIVRSLLPVLL